MKRLFMPLLTASALTLGACSQTSQPANPSSTETPQSSASERRTEVTQLSPRAIIAREGGLTVIDTATGETVTEVTQAGFLRLNDAGDGRHIMVTDTDTFRVFDSGLIAEGHEDHLHYYTTAPKMTDIAYSAPQAGHVSAHDGVTALFADGDGSIQLVDTNKIADPKAVVRTESTNDPHHGVAVQLSDASLFLTQGTAEERSVVQVRRASEVAAETSDCPGSHGEAVAKPNESGDIVVMGCTNGPVIYRDGTFHKVTVSDVYARSGNLAGSEDSTVVLADYKVDKAAQPERPTRVALIDTRSDSLKLVELGSSYWFRSLGRGPAGEGLVLTYDGNLTVIDVEQGVVTARIPVISQWAEKDEWQQPGPILKVANSQAYVTDAENNELVVVDLTTQQVIQRFKLSAPAVELAIATGKMSEHKH